MSGAGPSTEGQPHSHVETVFSTLYCLLNSHNTSKPETPYLHPYAPSPIPHSSPWKGKGKAVSHLQTLDDQLDAFSRLREAITGAKQVLGGVGRDDPGRLKLVRGLKEVTTHQTVLSSLYPPLHPAHSIASTIPSKLITLHPTQLLQTLASKLGIQTYIEDSQFGLLKTSLTLAGTNFVVDFDFETDALAGNEDQDEDAETSLIASGGLASSLGVGVGGGVGEVKLGGVVVTFVGVGNGGGTGKGEWVGRVLRSWMERYLKGWNASGKGELGDWSGVVEMEGVVRGLEGELRDLKGLDEHSRGETEGVDWFAELEEVGRGVMNWIEKEDGVIKMYSAEHLSIFPTFQFIPSTSATSSSVPIFRIRPLRHHEDVPSPHRNDTATPWLKGNWIIECVNVEGLVVRRNWLDTTGVEIVQDGWDDKVRIGQLLLDNDIGSSLRSPLKSQHGISNTHRPEYVSEEGTKSLEQHWHTLHMGPEGFIVGRIGIGNSLADLAKAAKALRRQVVLNDLFTNIFKSSLDANCELQDSEAISGEDDDIDLDDLLAPPKAISLSVQQTDSAIRIIMPLLQEDMKDSSLMLSVRPSDVAENQFVEISWDLVGGGGIADDLREKVDRAVKKASVYGRDLVRVIACIECELR